MEKPQILIVEDDLDLSEMLNAYFRVQNYEVMTAAWGEEALKIANEANLDLVILDIRLPDIDGYELCRRLRTNRKTQDLPMIFLTEKRDRVDKLQGLELGVVDYITKPFDIQELRLRIRNAINRARQPALVNPVTDLPEGDMVQDKLTEMLKGDQNWAVLQLTIGSLGAFRERYGFVAADDVLRAVALMIRNAVREYGNAEDFIGQLDPPDFIVITTTDHVKDIRDRIERRISQSREYFFPLRDRDRAKEAAEDEHLSLSSGVIDQSSGTFETAEDVTKALASALVPE